MFSVQEALDIVRNNQFANGPRYEQAWKALEAAVDVKRIVRDGYRDAVCANPTLEEMGFLREVLHHLELFTKTTGGDPYVSVAATLLRNRIAVGSPAEPPCLGEQCDNYPDGCSQCCHLERESLAVPRHQ